jgi:ATP sulfurylase
MKQECKCHKCDKEIEENYYCDECASYLKQYQYQQEQKQKPKINGAKLIHKAMFG